MQSARWIGFGLVACAAALLVGCGEERPDNRELALLETNRGVIVVELLPESAPLAVENFELLAGRHYYDGTIFHRVIPDFMIQGGDPLGNGTGGESAWGHPFATESDPEVTFDRPWRLGMANSGPNTNGSQFFITVIPTPWLNGKHTIFGNIIAGRDVVTAIATTATSNADRPLVPVVLERVRIEKRVAERAWPFAPPPR